jgi:hypothetical protein
MLSSDKPAAWDPALGIEPVKSMVIQRMDLATGRKYMYVRAARMAAGSGFSGGIAVRVMDRVVDGI